MPIPQELPTYYGPGINRSNVRWSSTNDNDYRPTPCAVDRFESPSVLDLTPFCDGSVASLCQWTNTPFQFVLVSILITPLKSLRWMFSKLICTDEDERAGKCIPRRTCQYTMSIGCPMLFHLITILSAIAVNSLHVKRSRFLSVVSESLTEQNVQLIMLDTTKTLAAQQFILNWKHVRRCIWWN